MYTLDHYADTPPNYCTRVGDFLVLTKKDILQRLYNQGHVTFDELYILIQPDTTPPTVTSPPITFNNPLPTTGDPLPPIIIDNS